MKKMIVIGCPGSGKSTFARKLRDITNLPLYYLDMLWHKPDQTNISVEEFDYELNKIIKKDKWIIDGNYQRTLEIRLKECDCIFLFDIPTEECITGAQARIGKKREDIPWIETSFDEQFKQQILNFSQKELPQIYKLLEQYQYKRKIIIFKTRKESENYLKAYTLIKTDEKYIKY